MKIWAVGDIHGYLKQFNNLWAVIEKSLSDDDKVIILGDVIDRGPDSVGTVQRLMSLKDAYGDRLVLLWGNHEDMACASLDLDNPSKFVAAKAYPVWWGNGGKELLLTHTWNDFRALMQQYSKLLELGYEDVYPDNTLIQFVHANLPSGMLVKDAYRESTKVLWSGPYGTDRTDPARVLVCGHLPQKSGYLNLPQLICVDAGSFITEQLTAVQLDTENKLHRRFVTVNKYGEV